MQRTSVIASASASTPSRTEASRSASSTESSRVFIPDSFASRVARSSIFLLKLDAWTISRTAATAVRELIGECRSAPWDVTTCLRPPGLLDSVRSGPECDTIRSDLTLMGRNQQRDVVGGRVRGWTAANDRRSVGVFAALDIT